MFDWIYMGFVELWETGKQAKIPNENICFHRESNQQSLAFQPGALDSLGDRYFDTFKTLAESWLTNIYLQPSARSNT